MKRILIVKDDAIIASGLAYALEQDGYTVVHSKTVSDAKNAIANDMFDLALLDMQLPDGTGLDVHERVCGKSSEMR